MRYIQAFIKNHMKNTILFLLAFAFAACNNSPSFIVKGTIEGATGEIIYLEHNSIINPTIIDSMVIRQDGEFLFKANSPEYPDFYKLILKGRQLHFAVDSTETIEIKSTWADFPSEYQISGSETNTDIQLLRKSVVAIQRKINELKDGMSPQEQTAILDELTSMIENHKEMARPLILKNPRSPAAYFAIFQQVNDVYIFSPYIKEDRPYCAAVATSFHTFMPEYERSVNLYNMVMDAISTERQQQRRASIQEMVDNASAGYINIELPDRKGINRKLSDLSGKLILLDFSAYESPQSVQYTFVLRDLHTKFASRGFEIFQVSLDRNEVLWRNATEAIPWIAVRDEDGPASIVAGMYNLTEIPTSFLINRKGDILGKNIGIDELERIIRQEL
jgi:peroxiredoxin